MNLMRVFIGALVGSIISAAAAIGLIFGGIQVSWWLAIILGVIGLIIGGFVAGFIAQDRFPGMIAGFITGLFSFGAIVLFFWLVLRSQVLEWWAASGNDIDGTIAYFLDYLGMETTSNVGQLISAAIKDYYQDYGSDINGVVEKYVPVISLIFGAVFGGGALIINTISGRIGGRLNMIDEIVGDD
jgi:hypothetical protein